jgi:hypothetical protein
MLKKRSILLLLGLIIISGFFLLPANQQWAGTLLYYWNDFQKTNNNTSIEHRMVTRFENHYVYSKQIADSLKQRGQQHALVLMPPNSYFKKMGIQYEVPVSPVFYYFTGIKTVWADNPHAIDADWYVRVSNGRIIIDSVTSRQALKDTITTFRKMGVSL